MCTFTIQLYMVLQNSLRFSTISGELLLKSLVCKQINHHLWKQKNKENRLRKREKKRKSLSRCHFQKIKVSVLCNAKQMKDDFNSRERCFIWLDTRPGRGAHHKKNGWGQMSGNSSPKYFESSYVSEVKVVGSWIYLQKNPSSVIHIDWVEYEPCHF